MNYRHGDLALIEIPELPKNLILSKSHILMTGSHGNSHSYNTGEFYPLENGFIVGYFVAYNNTILLHVDHGEQITPGNKKLRSAEITHGIYELRKQHEDTHDGMRIVID